jgi:hypothetical protein
VKEEKKEKNLLQFVFPHGNRASKRLNFILTSSQSIQSKKRKYKKILSSRLLNDMLENHNFQII